MVTLDALLERHPELCLVNGTTSGVRVDAVTSDSRACGPGTLFVAVRGTAADGHAFLDAAAAAGSAALLVATDHAGEWPVPTLRVADTRPWPARLSRTVLGDPDQALCMAGVTGTNGKTTTAHLLRTLLEETIGPCALLGTIRYETGRRSEPAPLTTPGGPRLFALLDEARGAGCKACAMEVSSHALDQERTAGLELDVGIMTNLSRDHLDYHADLDDYLRAKARIRELLGGADRTKPAGRLVLNAADPAIAGVDAAGLETVTYSAAPGVAADLRLLDARLRSDGSDLDLDWRGTPLSLKSRLVGRFNVENLCAALAAGLALGLAPVDCTAALARAPQVPGRMESFSLPSGATAVVDYAHTPDALAAVLGSCRELTSGRLIAVFGCGGDRDTGKRTLMGAVAARRADATWITSDNPRTEEPLAICTRIAEGFRAVTDPLSDGPCIEVDRTRAIRAALAAAADGDTVVIAGKGHEDYQLVGDRRLDLDDRRIVRDWSEEHSD